MWACLVIFLKGGVYVILKTFKMKYRVDKYTKILNRSQIISFKIFLFSGGSRGQGAWPDVSKMRYFLKQDNWVCIINNQLKFDI